MRTLIVSLLLLVLLLDEFAVGDDIDRTFHLFKKKKEKVKDKLKKNKDKPSYKPVIARTFRKNNKNKDKKKPKPSYKPHPPAVLSYNPPSYHGMQIINQLEKMTLVFFLLQSLNTYLTTFSPHIIPQPPVTRVTARQCPSPSARPGTSGPRWWGLITPGPRPRTSDPSDTGTTSLFDYLMPL